MQIRIKVVLDCLLPGSATLGHEAADLRALQMGEIDEEGRRKERSACQDHWD